MAPVSHIRGRRGGRAALAAAGAVVALGLAGCSIDLSHLRPGGGGEPEPSPEAAEPVAAAPLVEEALAGLATYPALTATGQVAESVDSADVRDTSLTVADTGTASGTIRANGVEAELISADSKLFIRAAENFWLDQGVFGPDFDDFDGNWVRASAAQAGFDPSTTLAPPELSAALGAIELESEEAVEENLDGTLTYRIDLAGERNQMWINAETNQVQRIAIEELVPEEAETGPQVRLDLAEADTAAAEELYDGVVATAEEELTGSRDARIEVGWDGSPDMSCEEGPDCTWSGTVRDAGGDGSGTVTVRMDVTFSNADIGEQTCEDSGNLEAGGTLELACSANYNIVSAEQQTYPIDGEAQLSTYGLTGGQQEEMLANLDEQREATLSGGASPSESAEEEEGGN
ncbi:hypothetical protein A6A08_13295 [Nocardiopsis sp. TSRI0078]|uniref:hypothetical protein n=1 Tax=unclassified Nocardiopsis TaxID=2649073 RepID=UPI00093F5741|nr:hypothetical protein [Nocardiopsis sp. TSRI0078]OKI14536.1 hypothetical protein A6A08_13295 [Nocardiopsis sp. TSRI0078]